MQETPTPVRSDYRRFDESNMWRGQPQNSDNSITTSQELSAWINTIAATAAGITVTHKEAMKCPAVKISIMVLAESVAQLPFNIIREKEGGQRDTAKNNPVHLLLSTKGKPNGWQSSFDFRRLLTRWVAARGNAYALKQTVGGTLQALAPVHPDRVRVEQEDDWRLVYLVRSKNGAELRFDQQDIFHLRGHSDDGITGEDPIKENADTIALALAQDRFASRMFSNGVNHSGVLEVPGSMKDDAFKRLKESFTEKYTGVDNSHNFIILENGIKFNKSSMTFEQAQLLDSRKLQRSILASLWRIPPHMIGDLEKATFSNIENLARQFVDYALMPWLDLWQQAIQTQLLTPSQLISHSAKFNVKGLLRGDAKTQADLYSSAYQNAWMSPNEIREKEDMPPREGGDEYAKPANMQADNGQKSGKNNENGEQNADD